MSKSTTAKKNAKKTPGTSSTTSSSVNAALNATGDIVASVSEQINELHLNDILLSLDNKSALDSIIKELQNLDALGGVPKDTAVAPNPTILKSIIAKMQLVQSGAATWSDSGSVFGDFDTLKQIASTDPTANAGDKLKYALFFSVADQFQQLISPHPDVTAVLSDLNALTNLMGGPADAVAFYDFNVLQIAFENVWEHAFDQDLQFQVENLYNTAFQTVTAAGFNAALPQLDPAAGSETSLDLNDLNEFIQNVQTLVNVPIPQEVYNYLPNTASHWNELPDDIRNYAIAQASYLSSVDDGTYNFYGNDSSKFSDFTWQVVEVQGTLNGFITQLEQAGVDGISGQLVNKTPTGRLQDILNDIANSLSEPYSFDIFAANSYNYGLMLTYRQTWAPKGYQAGDLRATIPLAPGESRKYSKKVNIKTSRAVKAAEKNTSDVSSSSSDTSRAETEIMHKATSSTSFKLTTQASFNIGLVDAGVSSEFSTNQANESINNKKQFHEATLKAAQDYRSERSMEIDTTSTVDSEDTVTSEISNPNNEITVTYLFYELQRIYAISEFLYRAQPVILVAQAVPAPHEINEEWLIQYQWILSRVLMDESFRPALNYLTSGMAGDEVSAEVIKAHWETQRSIVSSLQEEVTSYFITRDSMRSALKAAEDNVNNAFKIPVLDDLNFDNLNKQADLISSLKDRLTSIENELSTTQKQLALASSAFEKASDKYTEILQLTYTRHISIDQLRIHVKQNIFYYMQAIWSHEPPDQRYFRLYNLKVNCPGYVDNPDIPITVDASGIKMGTPDFSADDMVQLKEIADLDNPLGFKGNCIIFPLKKPMWITTIMLQEFIDSEYGISDPANNYPWPPNLTTVDEIGQWVAQYSATLQDQLKAVMKSTDQGMQEIYVNGGHWGAVTTDQNVNVTQVASRSYAEDHLKSEIQTITQQFVDFVNSPQNTDEIIVPSGQLFIEALTGTHPVLEEFKLLHRAEDVRKVKAEVRHAELENLRLAARLLENQNDTSKDNLLEDPDIEKKIIVQGNAGITVGTN